MNHITRWNRVAKQEFTAMDQAAQADWQDLFAKVNARG
jgi:hypothetical protein